MNFFGVPWSKTFWLNPNDLKARSCIMMVCLIKLSMFSRLQTVIQRVYWHGGLDDVSFFGGFFGFEICDCQCWRCFECGCVLSTVHVCFLLVCECLCFITSSSEQVWLHSCISHADADIHKIYQYTLPKKTNIAPEKMMIGRWVSFWDWLVLGANC